MNLLKCEVCNGNELVKENGFFVCQHCGCKYAPEEAKKLMVEFSSPVEIVKGNAEIERLLEMADNCLQHGITDEARRLYTQVTKEFPTDWRGWWGLIRCAPPVGAASIHQNILYKLEEVDRCVSVDPSAQFLTEYHRAISFAPDDQKGMVIHSQAVREKAIEVESAKARLAALNCFNERKQAFLNSTATRFHDLYKKKRRSDIMGWIGIGLIAIGVIKYIFDFHSFGDLLYIALLGGIGGVILSLAGNSNADTEYSKLKKERADCESLITRARHSKKLLEANLLRLQGELSTMTQK